jgi:hypothetical protein
MISFATGQSRFLTVSSLPIDRLQKGWAEATKGLEFAINFLRSNVGIDSPATLSSPFLMIVLAYFGHARGYELTGEDAEALRRWALLANAKGRYSRGSSETILDQDLTTVDKQASPETLLDRVRLQFGRLEVLPEDLEGRDQRSALFKTMFLAFRAGGARDWRSNLQIALDHSGARDRLQFHHIFPKALLKASYTSREADDIANLAFISGRTNRSISDKPPAEYLPKVIAEHGTELLERQAIPHSVPLLELSNFKQFLFARRAMIAERLNQFLETP